MPDARPSRTALLVVLLIGAVLAGVWVVTSGPDEGHRCRSPAVDRPDGIGHTVPAANASVNVTVRRVGPEAVRYEYGDLDDAGPEFRPSVPPWLRDIGVRVHSARGFAVYRSPNGTRLVWNESVPDPRVTLVTTPSAGSGDIDGAGVTITPEWAILPLLRHSAPTNVSLAADQEGVVGDRVLLLGEHRTVRREAECQEIRLHVPTAVETAEPPAAVAESLADASRDLDVGWRYRTVNVFGVGDPLTGTRTVTHEAWVNARSAFDADVVPEIGYPPPPPRANDWLHAALHTRQRWHANGSIGAGAAWVAEAMPAYYQVTETARQGRRSVCGVEVTWRRLNRSLHRGPGSVNLTSPATYEGSRAQYTKGAYVLAALDHELRLRTVGLRSLEDVVARLNDRENLTAAAVETAVVATGGSGMRAWLDRYVSGTAIPPEPAPPVTCWDSPSFGAAQLVVLLLGGGIAAVIVGLLLADLVVGTRRRP